MNSYMDYMKGNNNNTADSSPLDGEKAPVSNFNKIRQFVVDGSGKGLNSSLGQGDNKGVKK